MQIRQMAEFFLSTAAYISAVIKNKTNRPLFQLYTCQNCEVVFK